MLAQYMKTNLYKEWLESNYINQSLREESSSSLLIEMPLIAERLDYIIEQISRDTKMDFREPDTKVV